MTDRSWEYAKNLGVPEGIDFHNLELELQQKIKQEFDVAHTKIYQLFRSPIETVPNLELEDQRRKLIITYAQRTINDILREEGLI